MRIWFIAGIVTGAVLLVFAASQYATINKLQDELALLKEQLGVANDPSPLRAGEMESRPRAGDGLLGPRVLELEQRVGELGKSSEFLMERGQVPLTRAKADQLLQSLTDPGSSERDRVMAVRLLLRNNMFDDTAAGYVASLLPAMTDARLKREMLDQLEGATNSVLKGPLLQLAASDPDSNVREEAMQRLSRFSNDPQVQQQIWTALRDAEPDVRRAAQETLSRQAPSDLAIAQARQRGLSQDSTLEERMTAMRVLRNANQDLPELAGALAQAALDDQNPDLRLQVIRGLDGLSHPTFIPSLVQSLQDPNPAIRREAADSLSTYRDHATVNEWLQHAMQSDSDPRVRHEAADALGGGGRRGRGSWQSQTGGGR